MKHPNGQDTINPETGEVYGLHECKRLLDEALGPQPEVAEGDPVNNWTNGEGKEDYIWLLNAISRGEATPGHIKYIIRAAFQAGEFHGRAKALSAMALSLPVPTLLNDSTGAGAAPDPDAVRVSATSEGER